MAVYTDINEADLGSFLTQYDIGGLTSYKGIAEGVENTNFLLHTTSGAYFLTLYEKRVNPADLPFFLGLMGHLADRGVRCPLPIPRRDGAVTGTLAQRPAAIVSFVEGMWPRRPTVDHCAAIGAALARMHIAGGDFSLTRHNALSLAGWQALWPKCRADANGIEPGLAAETDAELAAIAAAWPSGLPEGVIHADLFPNNVLFLDGDPGLIDFYFACNDFLAYDLAICLNAWCFERDFSYNLTKGAAMLRGYQSVRPLSDQEVEALPILARGSALRFMLTRLYDWINTPAGSLVTKLDPLEYLRKLRFHRQVKSPAEYGLAAVPA